MINKLNADGEELFNQKTSQEENLLGLKKLKEDRLLGKTIKKWTKEEFLNYFENIENIVQNATNQDLLDEVVRFMFLNFTTKDRKVASYQLNPVFEKFIKPTTSLVSGTVQKRSPVLLNLIG